MERLTQERDEARSDADEAADERDDLRDAPWPKWADECLRIIRKHSGYDGSDDYADGIDLPTELDETLGEYEHQAQRNISEARVSREVESYRSATEWHKNQASGLRDKLATAETTLAEARSVLRQVEFDPGGVCPSCSKFEGHAPDCALAAILTTEPGDTA